MNIGGARMMQIVYIGHTGKTALGDIWVAVNDNGLVAIGFPSTHADFSAWLKKHHQCEVIASPEKTSEVVTQLKEYLAGQRRDFSLPVDWSVLNDFQRQVLKKVSAIPCGETRTYADIAEQINHPRSYRAVGRANATNPMPLVIPCHRVIGTDGKLHGYGAGQGLETKAWLLKMERGKS